MEKYKIITTQHLSEKQFNQIDLLWNKEYPTKLNDRFKLLFEGVDKFNHYIIEDKNKNVIAWAVDFEKDNEIRFSIIVNAQHQGKRFGKMLIEKLKEKILSFWVG